MSIRIESFGFNYGEPPTNAVFVADVRDIPSDAIDGLWQLTGKDKAVQDAVLATEQGKKWKAKCLEVAAEMLDGELMAVGCSEGLHRSVAIVEVVAEELRAQGVEVEVRHRDLAKSQDSSRDTADRLETMNAAKKSTARTWYEFRNAAPDTTEVFIYDEIGEGWFTEGVTAKGFLEALAGVKSSKIDLHLNSPGGSVFDGVAIANALERHPAEVTTYVDGLAASIATIIALSADRVVMAKNALFMIHNPWGGVQGSAEEMRKYADTLDKIRDTLAATYVARSNMTLEEVLTAMDAETWYTAEEAQQVGFVDEVGVTLQAAASFDLAGLGFRNAPKSAGRVLSQRNFDKIAEAHSTLGEVLSDAAGSTPDNLVEETPQDSGDGGAPDPVDTDGASVQPQEEVRAEVYVPGFGFVQFN